MKIPTRFPIAVHVLLCVAYFEKMERTTSEFIADSVNINPVVIRQVLQKLKTAQLVEVERGVGGAHLAKDPAIITLLDVFRAVGFAHGLLFGMNKTPNPNCPVGRSVNSVLSAHFEDAQNALEAELAKTTLADILEEINMCT